MNNAQNIIIRIVTGVLQDSSPKSNPYKKVTPVYLFLAICSFVVAIVLVVIFCVSKARKQSIYVDIARLQWTRKERIENGGVMRVRRAEVGFDSLEEVRERGESVGEGGVEGAEVEVGESVQRERTRMKMISRGACGVLALWVLGAWVAYFWGVATGNNS